MFKFSVLLLIFLNIYSSSLWATASSKVALVIGNAAYPDTPLKNPGNDANAMADKLQSLGFQVILRQNLKQRQIGSAIAEFRNAIQPGGVALFYYAGHGLQVRGENYLPAVDADILAMDDAPNQSINVSQVLAAMEESKAQINLVFLDACRNNPYTRSFRSAGNGLAKVNAPSGTLIHFATRPGSIASDGASDDKNGLYTKQLLQALDVPGLSVEQVMKRVSSAVKQTSNGKQEPWMEGNIDGDFFFRPPLNPAEQVQGLLQQSAKAYQNRQHNEVITLSREALLLEPRETTALANMAAAYLQLGQHQAAAEIVDRALTLNPNHAASYTNRGALRERSGQLNAALQDFQRGCQLASAQSCRNAERLSARR